MSGYRYVGSVKCRQSNINNSYIGNSKYNSNIAIKHPATTMHTILNTITITDAKLYPKLYMRAATLYYLRIEFTSIVGSTNVLAKSPQPIILYKLGYTTTSLNERVYGKLPSYKYITKNGRRTSVRVAGHNGMGLPDGTRVYEIATYSHRNASLIYQYEQELHRLHAKSRYIGANVMANGNTELYTTDILGLDNY